MELLESDEDSGDDEGRTDKSFWFDFFAKDDKAKDDGNDKTEFINRGDLGYVAELERSEIAEPREERGKGTGGEENPALFG